MDQALVAGRDYPNTYREFVGMFLCSGVYGLFAADALAGRVHLPILRGGFYPVESKPSPSCMYSLPPPDHGHCGYDLRQNANPTDDLV